MKYSTHTGIPHPSVFINTFIQTLEFGSSGDVARVGFRYGEKGSWILLEADQA